MKKDPNSEPLDEAYYEGLSQWAESEEFTISETAVVHVDRGEQPGREFLSQFMSEEELDAVADRGRGRPSMSGKGRSPSRQVRLPADLDAHLAARAAAEGRKVSAVMRDAVAAYLERPPAA